MHDIKAIRDNPQAFDAGLKRRGLSPMSPSLLAIDERRRAAILASEQAQARRNAASREIGDAKKAKDEARANKLMAEVAELKTKLECERKLVFNTADVASFRGALAGDFYRRWKRELGAKAWSLLEEAVGRPM